MRTVGNQEYMTTTDIANAQGVTRRTVYNWIKAGKFPTFKPGKYLLVLPFDYEKFVWSRDGYPELRYGVGENVQWNGTRAGENDRDGKLTHYRDPFLVTIFSIAHEDDGEPYYRGDVKDNGLLCWTFTDSDIDHERTAELKGD